MIAKKKYYTGGTVFSLSINLLLGKQYNFFFYSLFLLMDKTKININSLNFSRLASVYEILCEENHNLPYMLTIKFMCARRLI